MIMFTEVKRTIAASMPHIPLCYKLARPIGQGLALELYSKGVSPQGIVPSQLNFAIIGIGYKTFNDTTR